MTVEKFDRFEVKEGRLIGIAGGVEYEVEQIIMRDGKRTEVTYYGDGDLITITQSESSKYKDSIAERVGPTP